jgi:hypothetical protein
MEKEVQTWLEDIKQSIDEIEIPAKLHSQQIRLKKKPFVYTSIFF